eukprot:579743-Rhodomonas_salina.1
MTSILAFCGHRSSRSRDVWLTRCAAAQAANHDRVAIQKYPAVTRNAKQNFAAQVPARFFAWSRDRGAVAFWREAQRV